MNKLRMLITPAALCAASLFLVASANAQQAPPSAPGDEFFVVSSVDRAHNAMILLHPTEIASAYQTTDKTQYVDEQGKPLKLPDFRAGDTIFATYQTKSDGTSTLVRVRKGMMTVAELRRRYLPSLPVDAGQTSQTTPKPKTSSTTSNSSKTGNTKTNKPNTNNPPSNNPKSKQTSH